MSQTFTVINQHGEEVAFETLYDQHVDAIFRFVLHRVGDVAEAEDITAQTFFKALRNLHRFKWARGSFSAWLYRITINEVNSHYRGRRTESLADDDAIQSEIAAAEQQLAQNRLFAELHRALHALSAQDQTLVILRFFENQSFAEIAKIVGKRKGACTMAAHRALDRLKQELTKRGVDHERIRRCFEDGRSYARPGVQAEATS